MVQDGDLADQADVIVEGRVAAVAAGDRPATDYQIEVERVISFRAGRTPAGELTLRVPGGRAGRASLKIWGAPRFTPGERVLLFLAADPDGSYHALHLMLGAFHLVTGAKGEVAVRDLSEAHEVSLPGTPAKPGEPAARDLERFRSWLADRARGLEREPDYVVGGTGRPGVQQRFTYLANDGTPMRWFEFDGGGSVSWRADSGGQPGVPGGGFEEFQRALAAWNDDPQTPIDYRYAGETGATGGMDSFDGVNAILFDHPLADRFDCTTGGVLAIGGPWFDNSRRDVWNGATYVHTTGADIVINAGLDCFFAKSPNPGKAAAELFAHELGHTLGLGHSCGDADSGSCSDPAKNDALMRAYIHDDGRGARLAADDRAGLATLYAAAGASGPAGSSGGAPAGPAIRWTAPAIAGEVVAFEIQTGSGAQHVRWEFGADGAGWSAAACVAGTFCASHIFTRSGTYQVRAVATDDSGQSSVSTAAVTVGGPAVDLPGADSFLPSVALGRRGTEVTLQSDVWLHNAGVSATLVELTFLSAGGSGAHPPMREITVAPGTSVALPDVLGDLFGFVSDQQGALAISYRQPLSAGGEPPRVFAVSRSYANAPGHAGGFGQPVPEEPQPAWSSGAKVVAGILDGGGLSATLSVANLDSSSGRVHIALADSRGAPIGPPATLQLAPRALVRRALASLFPAAAHRAGPFTARVSSDGIRFSASATLTEMELNDPIFLPAAPLPSRVATSRDAAQGEAWIPRLAGGTSLASGLIVANAAGAPRRLTFELWQPGKDNRRPLSAERTVAPGATLRVDDVAGQLFGMGRAGGALHIRWSGPPGPPPQIVSLAFGRAGNGGGQAFGVRVAAEGADLEVAQSGIDVGAEESGSVRSSYGAVNLASLTTSFRLTLREGDGTVLATVDLSLKARQPFERDLLRLFPTSGEGANRVVETEVLAGGPVLTYLVNAAASGDVALLPGRSTGPAD